MIRERIEALGHLLLSTLPMDRAGNMAKAGVGRAIGGIGRRVPLRVRRQIPDFQVISGDHILNFREGRLYIEPLEEATPGPSHQQTIADATPAEGAQPDEGSPGFWTTLPRGVKTGMADIDGEMTVSDSLPRNEGDIRALIQRLRDTIDNLDDVEAFDVVEAVDDDMYQLWKELERKMQSHRRSEAKHQLKGMFTI